MIFTSPSAVRYFFSIMHQVLSNFREYFQSIDAIISIGPNTTKELISRNVSSIESKEHTINGTLRLAKRILSKDKSHIISFPKMRLTIRFIERDY